jgi:hypothetical protein
MDLLVSLLVGQPLTILAVAAAFCAAYLALRFRWPRLAPHPLPLLAAATAWALYAVWEGLVLLLTPEANIRVDLLLIWPLLGILSLWSLLRAFRSRR